jgi:hypothetical protein
MFYSSFLRTNQNLSLYIHISYFLQNSSPISHTIKLLPTSSNNSIHLLSLYCFLQNSYFQTPVAFSIISYILMIVYAQVLDSITTRYSRCYYQRLIFIAPVITENHVLEVDALHCYGSWTPLTSILYSSFSITNQDSPLCTQITYFKYSILSNLI